MAFEFISGNNLSVLASHFAINYWAFANRSTGYVALVANQSTSSMFVYKIKEIS